jgi:predicted RNA-binding protein (virulence factor B family)
MDNKEMWFEAVDYIYIYLPWDSAQWRAVGNSTNHRVA